MKQLKGIIKTSLRSILKNRMRSLLTSLGIIIGVGAVIIMTAVGQGTQERIKEEINSLGTNLITVFPGASRTGGVHRGAGSFNRFTVNDYENLQKKATLITDVTPVVRASGQIIAGSNNWSTQVYGVDVSYFTIKDWETEYGYFFTDKDIRSKKKVALLGKTVADELFPDSDPTGERIQINNTPFTVLGVLVEKGQMGMGQDQDDVIIAPYTTVLYRLKGGQYIDMINASAVSVEQMDAAEEEIGAIMRESHRLKEGDEDDFTIRNQTEITEAVTETTDIMTMLLAAIASVSLVVGGIGIMNIMLVSVTERTREIGIRLSVGARGGDILAQFLAEAFVLSITGGLLGVLFAFLTTHLINEFTDLYTLIRPFYVVVAIGFSGIVGMFFGYYPAKKAAALNPIDALRHE